MKEIPTMISGMIAEVLRNQGIRLTCEQYKFLVVYKVISELTSGEHIPNIDELIEQARIMKANYFFIENSFHEPWIIQPEDIQYCVKATSDEYPENEYWDRLRKAYCR
jgi:hypothetical protein